jgi:signal recognition particle receptor subunit beta
VWQLRDSVFGPTVTSMAVNEARVAVRGAGGAVRSVRLLDLPGHPRLRGLLDDAAPNARATVYLVDGRDGVFLPAVRETAECVAAHFHRFSRLLRIGFPVLCCAGLADGATRAGCCWTC